MTTRLVSDWKIAACVTVSISHHLSCGRMGLSYRDKSQLGMERNHGVPLLLFRRCAFFFSLPACVVSIPPVICRPLAASRLVYECARSPYLWLALACICSAHNGEINFSGHPGSSFFVVSLCS